MSAQTAIVIGATGMVGSILTRLLLEDSTFGTVRLISRRPPGILDPKLQVQIVEFDKLSQHPEWMGKADAVFCCIGTTNSNVKGNKEEYRKVDYDIPLNAAHIAIQNGCDKFLLVSAVGADMHSGNFYLQLKGESEASIKNMHFKAVHIFRPSLLMGERKEQRLGEGIAKVLAPIISPFLVGRLSNYKPIRAETVAKAMLHYAKTNEKGIFVHHFKEMKFITGVDH